MAEINNFIEKIAPFAQTSMVTHGILASVTLAQACLESSYGTSELATKAKALFGIKALSDWQGKTYIKNTQEEENGVMKTISAVFRAYSAWGESIIDHGKFLFAKNRYDNIIDNMDYKSVCKNLQADGYSTSSVYANKLIEIIERYGLTKYDVIESIAAGAGREDKAVRI